MTKLKAILKRGGNMIFAAAPLALPMAALAQLDTPESPLEGVGLSLEIITGIINRIAQFMLTVGVVVAVIFIIWGGVKWMMAGDDPNKVDSSKARIKNGIIGAAIILGVGLILATISKVVGGEFFGGFNG